TLYIDGIAVASGSTNDMTLAQIKNDVGSSGFIGKSFYLADPYFGGMIADFQVYNGALTSAEVAGLKVVAGAKIALMEGMFAEAAASNLTFANIAGTNLSEDAITTDLALPAIGDYSTSITWRSSNTDVISDEGKVTRPLYEHGDQTVTIRATISDGVKS